MMVAVQRNQHLTPWMNGRLLIYCLIYSVNISEGKKKDGFATAPGAMRQGHTSLPGTSRIFFTFQTSNGRKLAVEAKRIEAVLSTTFHFLAAMSSDSQRHTLQVDENSPTKVRPTPSGF